MKAALKLTSSFIIQRFWHWVLPRCRVGVQSHRGFRRRWNHQYYGEGRRLQEHLYRRAERSRRRKLASDKDDMREVLY